MEITFPSIAIPPYLHAQGAGPQPAHFMQIRYATLTCYALLTSFLYSRTLIQAAQKLTSRTLDPFGVRGTAMVMVEPGPQSGGTPTWALMGNVKNHPNDAKSNGQPNGQLNGNEGTHLGSYGNYTKP